MAFLKIIDPVHNKLMWCKIASYHFIIVDLPYKDRPFLNSLQGTGDYSRYGSPFRKCCVDEVEGEDFMICTDDEACRC